MMGAFSDAAQCLLCSDRPNLLSYLYCSGEIPVTEVFPAYPGISTSMSLVYLHAVLDFFQNARCIIVGRSSPTSARVSAPPDRKKCVVNAVRSPALRACSAFGIYGADMGGFPPLGVPVFGRWEIFGKRYASVIFQPSADCSYGARGHTLSIIFYGYGMIGAASHRLFPLETKSGSRVIWWP